MTPIDAIAAKADELRPHLGHFSADNLEALLEEAVAAPGPDLLRAGAIIVMLLERTTNG